MNLRHALSASAAVVALGLGAMALAAPGAASAQISIGVGVNAPPPLIPIFAQPAIPGYGYIWTPGYWAWDPTYGYYWVPGEWVLPPEPGLLWTPGYWAWRNGDFSFIDGYWGPSVGFYGGVDYGHGYGGLGYQGAEWRGGHIYYNRAANNFAGARIATTFTRPVSVRTHSRIAYSGGRGGLAVRPSAVEAAAARARHVRATAAQTQRAHIARTNPTLRADSVSHGRAAGAVAAIHRTGPEHAARPGRPVTPRSTPPTAVHRPSPGRAPTEMVRPTSRPGVANHETPRTARTARPGATSPAITPGPERMGNGRPSRFQGEARPNRPAAPAPMTAMSRGPMHSEAIRPGAGAPTAHPMAGPAMRPAHQSRPTPGREPSAKKKAAPNPAHNDEGRPPS